MVHDRSLDEVFASLNADPRGMSSDEASKRLIEFGPNIIAQGKRISPLKLFFKQFTDLLVLVLIAAAIVTMILAIVEKNYEEFIDVAAIILVVALNASLGFYQEYSAEKAISALTRLSISEITAFRDHQKVKLQAPDLVPGDIIVLEAGTSIPADIRVIEAFELRINESILTGESLPVKKRELVLRGDTVLAERTNMLFKGTTVTGGSGSGIVAFTGGNTELGKIASSLQEIAPDPTPLQVRLEHLAKQLTFIILGLAAAILIIGLFLGRELGQMIIFSIGLAVAAIPEGLPAVLTLTLAIGVGRLARKRALIRKLPAVEVIGSTTVICTDKTGTLTKNEMTVKLVWSLDRVFEVSGSGYANNGTIVDSRTGSTADPKVDPELRGLLESLILVNDASIIDQGNGDPFKVIGDPTEVALLVLGAKAGLTLETTEKTWSKEFVFPFDSDRKMMSIIASTKSDKSYRIMVKGAPEVLIERCTQITDLGKTIPITEAIRKSIVETSGSYSKNFAYRMLGVAIREIDSGTAEKLKLAEDHDAVEENLTFLGLVAQQDPARDQSAPAIAKAKIAGIRVIMITGDHAETARAIGRSIGLVGRDSPDPITGAALEAMSDAQLSDALEKGNNNIFARVSPHHKLRIVNALKSQGEIVVMTGDGVNDAPALKRADIGVAMGISGTDVAKEASQMILVDDNFSNIVESIAEGRTIFDNMKKFIGFLLSANAGEVLTVVLGLIIGVALYGYPLLPLLAIQLLFINLVTDTFPALALGVDTPETDVMNRPPRDPREPLLSSDTLGMIVTSGSVQALMALLCFFLSITPDMIVNITTGAQRDAEDILIKPMTMAFTAIVIFQLIHAVNTSERGTIFSRITLKNKALILAVVGGLVLQLAAIYVAQLNAILHTIPLSGEDWLLIILASVPVLLVEELRKFVVKPRPLEAI